eukprot:GHVN01039122.1.p1 GENE.GHVN01039122.1~~GHVN01039122.1.p1  ORF type:complete len:292 (+),score=23.38 GHVN01039122.1:417-1292(+)
MDGAGSAGAVAQPFCHVWETEEIPLDWRKGRILPPYKGKGDREALDSYRGITLLEVAGKVFTKILGRRLKVIVEATVDENQYGFRAARSCTDCIFLMRLLIEKSVEHRQGLYAAFVDIRRAFDTVSRDHILTSLANRGAPDKLVRLIRLLHQGTTAQVEWNGRVGAEFAVETGVRQGCTIASLLFVLVMDDIWREMRQRADGCGVQVRYSDRWDVNTARKKLERLIWMSLILFADDGAIVSETVHRLEAAVEAFRVSAAERSLAINDSKSKLLAVLPQQRETPSRAEEKTV